MRRAAPERLRLLARHREWQALMRAHGLPAAALAPNRCREQPRNRPAPQARRAATIGVNGLCCLGPHA